VAIISNSSDATVFVCANCARPAKELTSAGRTRPAVPDFNWPQHFQQIVVPCAGRLQPEHILKAFESGSSIVSVIACREDNCHFIEGSKRCARRVDYIRSILKQIGLGDERLLLSYLPGSAAEDMNASAPGHVPGNGSDEVNKRIIEIRARAMHVLRNYPSSPLKQSSSGKQI
jgi:coenzyme F420-reducing hydrogenase delta subunit